MATVVFEFEQPKTCHDCPLLYGYYDDFIGKDRWQCKALKGSVDGVYERRWVSCPLKKSKDFIPIEWIKNVWLKDRNNSGVIEFWPQPTFEDVMSWLIKAWRRENEID